MFRINNRYLDQEIRKFDQKDNVQLYNKYILFSENLIITSRSFTTLNIFKIITFKTINFGNFRPLILTLTIDKFSDITKGESSPAKVDSQESSQKRQSADSKERKEEESKGGEKKEEDTEKEREKAATRIQAAFRGHHARKSMKDIESSTKQTGTKSNSEPTKEQLQQEFRADDKGECHVPTLEIVPKGEPFNFTEFLLFLPISSRDRPSSRDVLRSFVVGQRIYDSSPLLLSMCITLWCLCASYVTMCQETLHYFGAILCRIKLYGGDRGDC